jgi:hypothetical protein
MQVPSGFVREGAAMLSKIVWLRIPEFTHSRSPEYASRGTKPPLPHFAMLVGGVNESGRMQVLREKTKGAGQEGSTPVLTHE